MIRILLTGRLSIDDGIGIRHLGSGDTINTVRHGGYRSSGAVRGSSAGNRGQPLNYQFSYLAASGDVSISAWIDCSIAASCLRTFPFEATAAVNAFSCMLTAAPVESPRHSPACRWVRPEYLQSIFATIGRSREPLRCRLTSSRSAPSALLLVI